MSLMDKWPNGRVPCTLQFGSSVHIQGSAVEGSCPNSSTLYLTRKIKKYHVPFPWSYCSNCRFEGYQVVEQRSRYFHFECTWHSGYLRLCLIRATWSRRTKVCICVAHLSVVAKHRLTLPTSLISTDFVHVLPGKVGLKLKPEPMPRRGVAS